MPDPNQPAESTQLSSAIGRPSQCRRDALSGRWVIFAPGRGKRPAEIIETELPVTSGGECPFCAGNERSTPPATLCLPDNSSTAPGWSVRVVPNLFPAVSPEEALEDPAPLRSREAHALGSHVQRSRQGGVADNPLLSERNTVARSRAHGSHASHAQPAARAKDAREQSIELFEAYELHGGHEVIVESPRHVESITQLSPAHAAQVFVAYAERMKFWFDVPGVEYVVAFKNMGAAAGASLRHTHSQLIATSLLPPAALESGQRMVRYHRDTKRCLLCETIAAEQQEAARVVCETDSLIAFCPFASRLPYLIRVAPKRHLERFELETSDRLAELSHLTQQLVGAMESMFVSCAYNYTIHTRPRHVACGDSFHWWMEIFPRLTKVAGFEWGSDCYINPVTPEVAAAHLRGEPFGQQDTAAGTSPCDFSD